MSLDAKMAMSTCASCSAPWSNKFSVYFHVDGLDLSDRINYVRFYLLDKYEVLSFVQRPTIPNGITDIYRTPPSVNTLYHSNRIILEIPCYIDVFSMSLVQLIDKINLYVLMS